MTVLIRHANYSDWIFPAKQMPCYLLDLGKKAALARTKCIGPY